MAKVNYSFEKRQREIAKKKKQEQKLAEKRQRKAAVDTDTSHNGEAPTVNPPSDD